MFDTWSKNNEQKCWADLHTRFHPGSFSSDLSSFSIFVRPPKNVTEVLLFSWCVMAKVQGTQTRGKHFLKPTSHTKTLFSTTTEQKEKKKEIENMVMLFTQLSLICLDLNYKHTSIFQLHTSPTYSVPLDRYSLLLLETLSRSLVPTVL